MIRFIYRSVDIRRLFLFGLIEKIIGCSPTLLWKIAHTVDVKMSTVGIGSMGGIYILYISIQTFGLVIFSSDTWLISQKVALQVHGGTI